MYTIKRYYAPHVDKPNEIIEEGLTLEEAKEHCARADTHCVEWLDGYYKQDEDDE